MQYGLLLILLFPGRLWAQAEVPKKALIAHPIPSISEKKGGKEIPSLTLEKSITYAIDAATTVIKARGDAEISAQQLMQGYLQFGPNLALTGTYTENHGNQFYYQQSPTVVNTANEGATYQISTTINIFNGLADLGSLKSALNRRDAADLTVKRAKQQIALDVAQSFLQVVLDQQIVKIAEKNLISSQARESLLTEQTRVGVRNLADLFRQQAETSSDEAFLVTSQNKERTDALQLLTKLRLDPSINYHLVEPMLAEEGKELPYEDEDKMVHIGLENRADLKASQDTAKAADWDLTSARSTYFPRLDFGASMASLSRILDTQMVNGVDFMPASQNSQWDQLRNQVNYTYGITLTWNIFDRWSTRVATERARVAAQNAQVDSEDHRNEVVAEVRQSYGDYRTVLQQLESSKKGLQAAQKAYEVVEGRYQVGSASFVDLATAQAVLVQAEAARAQALIAFALQVRAVETALGTVAVD